MTKTLLKKWQVTAISLAFVALLAATALSSSLRVSQTDEPQVVNKTKAFSVISIERKSDSIRDYFLLRMKNVSTKSIDGYTIAFNNHAGSGRDYGGSDKVIAPGEIEEYEVSAGDVLPQEPISITSVVFTDGTSEGDSKWAFFLILDARRGRKLFLERLLPLYEKALGSHDADIDELEAQINGLPEQVEGESVNVNYSYRNAKSFALREIRELKEARSAGRLTDVRSRLQEMKEEKEKQKGRL